MGAALNDLKIHKFDDIRYKKTNKYYSTLFNALSKIINGYDANSTKV